MLISQEPTLVVGRGISIGPPRFSPDDRYVAYPTLALGARWLTCYDLDEGRQRFEVKLHKGFDAFGWSRLGRLVTLAQDPPLRVVALDPSGAVTATFEVPDGDFGRDHWLTVTPGGNRALLWVAQRNDDPRYERGGPGYAWVLDADTLAPRRGVDMREVDPPDGVVSYVINVFDLHPFTDDLAVSSYVSGEGTRHFLDLLQAAGASRRHQLPVACNARWLGAERLLIHTSDPSKLEPGAVRLDALGEIEPLGVRLHNFQIAAVEHDPARLLYWRDGALRAFAPGAAEPHTTELELPRAVRALGSSASCLLPGGPPWRALFAYEKRFKEKPAAEGEKGRMVSSLRIADTDGGPEREVHRIPRLRASGAFHEALQLTASPGGRWLALTAQEELKRFLAGHLAVAPMS